MKAIVAERYGTPDVLEYKEVAQPEPKSNELFIQVHAAALNALDWHLLRGMFLVRPKMGLLKPKASILGADVAGVVVAVGADVTQFEPGDAVFGNIFQTGLGALAEYVCTTEDRVVKMADGMLYEAAAAIPVAGVTALQSLRKGEVKAGQKVLVNGASGGVGTYVVQLAKLLGAEVTGVCSTGNIELVRSLGANHVIDYTVQDFTKDGKQYDVIIDVVGNYKVKALKQALHPEGVAVVVGFTSVGLLLHTMLLGSWRQRKGKQRIGLLDTKMTQDDLEYLRDQVMAGKLTPAIDRRYQLPEAIEAMHYLSTRKAKGKLVITV